MFCLVFFFFLFSVGEYSLGLGWLARILVFFGGIGGLYQSREDEPNTADINNLSGLATLSS